MDPSEAARSLNRQRWGSHKVDRLATELTPRVDELDPVTAAQLRMALNRSTSPLATLAAGEASTTSTTTVDTPIASATAEDCSTAIITTETEVPRDGYPDW